MVFHLKPVGDGLQPTFCHCSMSPDNIDNEAVHELMSSDRGRTALTVCCMRSFDSKQGPS